MDMYSLLKLEVTNVTDGIMRFEVHTLQSVMQDENGVVNGATYKQNGPFFVNVEPEVEKSNL